MNDKFLSCDRYNLVSQKYYKTRHCLPYHIDNSTSLVIANMEETLVVIYTKGDCHGDTRGRQDSFIIFTEEQGFEEKR